MFFALVIKDYFVWHYTRAWFDLFSVWQNCLWFVIHWFSIGALLRSLFAPFKRMTQERGDLFNAEAIAEYIIINLLSRVVGALVRSFILLLGIISLGLTIIGGFMTYLFWMVAPFAVIGLIMTGLGLLFI